MILASSLRHKIKGKKNTFSQAVMQVFLPPELEQFIQGQIATGKYQSALEVITAGFTCSNNKTTFTKDDWWNFSRMLKSDRRLFNGKKF